MQGEHKLARGFMPVTSYSTHWVRHEGFADALTGYLASERETGRAATSKIAGEHTPFKQTGDASTGA